MSRATIRTLMCGIFFFTGCMPAYQSMVIVVTPYENGQTTIDLHARLATVTGMTPDVFQKILSDFGLTSATVKVQP